MKPMATIGLKAGSSDPVRDLWNDIKELAVAGAWRLTQLNELAAYLSPRARFVLETAYNAAGQEVQLQVVTNPYLDVPVFQIRRDEALDASYVNPANALLHYTELTTVAEVSFPLR